MTSKKSSHNNGFMPMFKEAMRKSCFFPILLFVLGGTFLLSYSYDKIVYIRSNLPIDPEDFFLNGLNIDIMFFVNVILIFGAVVSAISIFGFQWSRKYSNVIYSLGMKRSNIFLSKILGGLVPMIGSIVTLLAIATISDAYFGCKMDSATWKKVLFLLVSTVAVYTLAYVLCSVVFVNVGNAVEAIIFTPILALFPTILSSFLDYCKVGYTLGGNSMGTGSLWTWNEPFFLHTLDKCSVYNMFFGSYPQDVDTKLTFIDFTGSISALIYAIVIFALGFYFFKKSKNDYSGSWGRTKGIAEIVGAVVGFYAFDFTIYIFTMNGKPGNENVITFIACCVAFLLAQVIFKLIFSNKRKVAFKKTLNRFPAYVAVMGSVTLVFALGLFGYAGYIPEASEIEKVTVGSLTFSHNDNTLRNSSFYALHKVSSWRNNEPLFDENQIQFTDADEIGEIRKLHKTIITDGKIKDSADDSCAARIDIIYTLKNGKVVVRSYYESTTDTVKKILKLNDLETVKERLREVFTDDIENINKSVVQEYFVEDITVDYESNFIYRKSDGTQVGYIETVYDMDYQTNITYLHFMDGKEPVVVEKYENQLYNGYQNLLMLYGQDCFLFPKDMSKGFGIGIADEELLKALRKDILAQTAEQYYLHRPEDEIGVLSFGLSYTERNEVDPNAEYDEYGNYVGDDGEIYDADPENTSWNILSDDIKAIVLTKDMENTIKYLESHDLMKHFENSRNISDIKSVKVATPAELYGSRTLSDNIPLFVAGYWTSETVKIYNQKALGWTPNYFADIQKKITDVNTIKKLVNSSMLFGFCGNDYGIMEIEYTDGSLETVMIPADVYKTIK